MCSQRFTGQGMGGERERERDVHSDDVARGIVVEGAITYDSTVKAFLPPTNRDRQIPFFCTWNFS